MARGFFSSRSRAHTDGVSKPSLVYSDALPRDDLQMVGSISGSSDSPGNRTHRSKTHDGMSPVVNGPFHANGINSPTINMTESPHQGQSNLHIIDSEMIGVALGSPSMVSPPALGEQRWQYELRKEDAEATNETPIALRRQPSKWKKMANLFKAKPDNSKAKAAFYQMPLPDDPQFQCEHLSTSNKPSFPSIGEEPQGFSPWSTTGKKESHSAVPWSAIPPTPPDNLDTSKPLPVLSPLLQIDIPESQMERYSVMFSGILGVKKQKSLLDRRSKTIGKLSVTSEEDPSSLHLRPRRAATSPCHVKSPGFTLFPPTPRMAKTPTSITSVARADGLIKPLRRVATAPPDSPMGPPSSKFQQLLRVETPHSTLSLLSTSSADYSDSSYMTADERSPGPFTAKREPSKSYVDESKEPRWEMVQPQRSTPPYSPKNSVDSTPTTSPEDLPPMTPPKDFPPTPPQYENIYGRPFPSRTDSQQQPLPPRTSSIDSAASQQEERQPQPPPKDHYHQSRIPGGLNPPRTRADLAVSPSSKVISTPSLVLPSSPPIPQITPPKDLSKSALLSPDPGSREQEIILSDSNAEISIARSVSISKRSKQTLLVPLGTRADQLKANERLVERQPLTVNIVDVRKGHRPGRSQDVRIDTVQ